jgi:orotidine-5'-phosphate decarboxylase
MLGWGWSEQMTSGLGCFSDRLAAAVDRCGAPACVGIDPVLEKLPGSLRAGGDAAGALEEFSIGVIDAVAGVAPLVKPQSACFERHGAPGMAALGRVIAHAKERGLLVVLDAKRGDIGVSAEHYAAAAFDGDAGADAVTVSGYLGPDTVEPFLRPGRGVFVLVRTSNPGSDAVQSQRLADGRTVGEMMAEMVASLGKERMGERGLSDVGAVVGATKAADGRALRARMPNQVFLVPGYGAQGGTLDDVRQLVRAGATRAGDLGVLVNASRSVIYAFKGEDWRREVHAAAESFVRELRGLEPGH